ncbi:TPA: hypothetical protein ACNP34_004095, partial [Citrobacter freundii]
VILQVSFSKCAFVIPPQGRNIVDPSIINAKKTFYVSQGRLCGFIKERFNYSLPVVRKRTT